MFVKIGRVLLSFLLLPFRLIAPHLLPPLPSAHLILKKNNRYLVIDRSDGQGVGFPAGIIRTDETPEQCAARETREETGLKTKVTRLVGVYYNPHSSLLHLNSIYIVYSGRTIGGKLRRSIEGEPLWLSREQMLVEQPFLAGIISDYEKGSS